MEEVFLCGETHFLEMLLMIKGAYPPDIPFVPTSSFESSPPQDDSEIRQHCTAMIPIMYKSFVFIELYTNLYL